MILSRLFDYPLLIGVFPAKFSPSVILSSLICPVSYLKREIYDGALEGVQDKRNKELNCGESKEHEVPGGTG